MRAVLADEPLPASDPRSLVDAEVLGRPAPAGHDLLVRVEAVSVNPVDTKMRRLSVPGTKGGRRILVIGAAGGVGSMAIQIGRVLGWEVIATASRPQSRRGTATSVRRR